MKYEVPIWKKTTLTLTEAAVYTGIGINRLRELTGEYPALMVRVGSKRMIKRRLLEKYLENSSEIL